MAATLLLLSLLVVAAVTDLRWHRVYNWITYPGMLIAVAANAVATFAGNESWGLVGVGDSITGLLGCGFLMLVCYVFFPGGVGGGDVKLIAMIGAFLGPYRGFEAALWTFVLGGCVALVAIVWRLGAIRLLRRGIQLLSFALRFRTWGSLEEEEREQLKTNVFLAPSSLAAVLVVQLQLGQWL